MLVSGRFPPSQNKVRGTDGRVTSRRRGAFERSHMSVDKATVRHIAKLARIGVPEEELAHLAGELNNILGWVAQLDEVDTADVPPLASVHEGHQVLRADLVTDGGIPDQVLANAPKAEAGFFAVPKVVE